MQLATRTDKLCRHTDYLFSYKHTLITSLLLRYLDSRALETANLEMRLVSSPVSYLGAEERERENCTCAVVITCAAKNNGWGLWKNLRIIITDVPKTELHVHRIILKFKSLNNLVPECLCQQSLCLEEIHLLLEVVLLPLR